MTATPQESNVDQSHSAAEHQDGAATSDRHPHLERSADRAQVDSAEALLRQVVALRAASASDQHLAQLIRIVDSATWSAPVPMTILVDGTLLRGMLVPSEVSTAFIDDALRRSADTAVDELEQSIDDAAAQTDPDPHSERAERALRQARAFLQRVKRRPFSHMQAQLREHNAGALMALNEWHETRDPQPNLTTWDVPGSYADPTSAVRDVVSYTVGQRVLTLADVEIMVAGEWQTLTVPFRVILSRIGAWTVGL